MGNIPGPHQVVIVNRHEPEHEVAGRLLELAEEGGHDVRSVEAVRGEHDAALSFRVPEGVAEKFNEERGERWPAMIENDDEMTSDQESADGQDSRMVNGDAVAADNHLRARNARVANTEQARADEEKTATDRKARPGKAQNAKE